MTEISYSWTYSDADVEKKLREIDASVKAREKISREDYLHLMWVRLDQIKIAQIVCRLAYKHLLFHKFYGLTGLYDDPELVDLQRDFADGESGPILVDYLKSAIYTIEQGATRQDMIKESRKNITGVEVAVDTAVFLYAPMHNLCSGHFNAHTLKDFEYLERVVARGHFAPAMGDIPGFGVAWYGPRGAYEAWGRVMGDVGKDGVRRNPFNYRGDLGLTSDQMWMMQVMTNEERVEMKVLADQDMPRPDPWW